MMYDQQGGACAICGISPKRLLIDHEHLPGYKKLPTRERARAVRGLLCWVCNLYRVGKNNKETALEVSRYFGN